MISKPKDYLKNLLKDQCIFLTNCCFNKKSLGNLFYLASIKDQIEASLNSDGFIDLDSVLPSGLDVQDIENLLNNYLKLSIPYFHDE